MSGLLENVKTTVVETKVKKPRTEKQLAATAKLLATNQLKRELLAASKASAVKEAAAPVPVAQVAPPVAPVSVAPPVAPVAAPVAAEPPVTMKAKRVYKKRESQPVNIPPPLPVEYSDSYSDEEQWVPTPAKPKAPPKPKRAPLRFRVH